VIFPPGTNSSHEDTVIVDILKRVHKREMQNFSAETQEEGRVDQQDSARRIQIQHY
jgi:hypothetical protein